MEGLEDCARREVEEETWIKTGRLELMSVNNDMADDAHFVTIGLLCRDFEGEPRVNEPDEITEWKWFPLGALPEPLFPPAVKMLNNYKSKRVFGE